MDNLRTLCPSLDPENTKTWKADNLPSSPRTGLMQGLVSTLPSVLEIRSHRRTRKIFEVVYSGLRKEHVTEFFTSMDGINVRPHMAPYQNGKDWAHLDQTIPNNPFLCVQGQVVLSDTSACFRASPRSYRVYDQILENFKDKIKSPSDNWFMIPKGEYKHVQELVESVGGQWQVPIRAPKGSVILWSSSTIHSAMTQQKDVKAVDLFDSQREDPWADWRFIVYVCHRPKEDVTVRRKQHAERLQKCLEESRVTNHWGGRMFPKKPYQRFGNAKPKEETIEDLTNNPEKVRELIKVPKKINKKIQPLITL